MSYYDCLNLNILFPNIWHMIKDKFLSKEGITLEQVRGLDDMIQVMDVKSADDIKMLPKKEQELYAKLKQVYDKNKKNAHVEVAADPLYYDQTAAYYYQPGYQYNAYYQNYQNAGAYGYPYQTYPNQQYTQYNQYGNQYGNQQYANQQQQYANQQQQQYGYQNHKQRDYGHQHNNQNQNYQNYNQNQNYQNYNQNSQNYNYNQNYPNQHQQYDYTQLPQDYTQLPQDYTQRPYDQNHNQKYVEKAQNYEETPEQTAPQIQPKHEEQIVQPVKVEQPVIETKKLSIEDIRKLVAAAVNKQELKKATNPILVQEIQATKKWTKKVENVQAVAQPQGDRQKKTHNKEFQKGKNFDANAKQYERKNYGKPPGAISATFDIQIGKNEDLQTKLVKNKLKEQAAGGDYAQLKADEQKTLDKAANCKRQILYKLNQVAPENVKQISNDIQQFAVKDEDICNLLAQQIMKKAWQQPKYAASYAKLSQYLVRIAPEKFEFKEDKDVKKNPFKHILIQKVQHSFDKKEKKAIPESQEDKEKFARQKKNLIMGNVKFIAELIKIKLIPKKIIKVCITQLLLSFIEGYYFVNKQQKLQYAFFEFYFEAIIQFLQNLGEKYEEIAEPSKKQVQQANRAKASHVQAQIKQFCQLKKFYPQIVGLQELRADQYFTIINIINSVVLPKLKDGRRLSALLQNLTQRRDNGWKKHNVQSEGPKKLKDLKYDDQASSQHKMKVDLNQLDDKMSKLLKKWVEGDTKIAIDEIESLGKKYTSEDLIGSYLRNVAQDKKESVLKRLELFNMLVDRYLQMSKFKHIWSTAIQQLSTLQSQFPFCAAVLSKILINLKEKRDINYSDFFIKYNEDDAEDEFYFMDNIFQKLYHYSQDQKVKQFIEPKSKISHLL